MIKVIATIDEKDRKILLELDKNARVADSQIAKNVRLSKQVTNYRIKNLVDAGIIKNFYAMLDVGKLGFSTYYVFLQLESINEKEEKELLDEISNRQFIGWLVNGTGRWDVVFSIYAQTTSIFDKCLNEVLRICKNRIHEYNFTTMVEAEHLGYKFLGSLSNEITAQSEKKSNYILDQIDKKILSVISQDARIPVVDLSAKLKIPVHVATYHLKELFKKEIIQSCKPMIKVNSLGYQWHLLLLQLSTTAQPRKKEFIDFCKTNSKVYYVTQTIGTYNLMLDLHLKSTEEFKEVLFELKGKFADVIKFYESIIIFNEYKITYFSETF